MAQCIKAGAFVLFVEYGFASAADLFLCGDQVIIQWNTNGRFFQAPYPRNLSHTVLIKDGYHHDDRGITVVDRRNVLGL